jgi:hypothetical protein
MLLCTTHIAPLVVPFSFVDIERHIGMNFWDGYWTGRQIFDDVLIQMLYSCPSSPSY